MRHCEEAQRADEAIQGGSLRASRPGLLRFARNDGCARHGRLPNALKVFRRDA